MRLHDESCSDSFSPMRQTPLSRLIEMKLGEPLRGYVIAARTVAGPLDRQAGWRAIATDLSERTGERVTWETLRSWFDDEREGAAEQVPA